MKQYSAQTVFGWGCERGNDMRDGLRKVNWEREWNNNYGKTTKGERQTHGSETALKEEVKILPSLNYYAVTIEMTPCVPEELKKKKKTVRSSLINYRNSKNEKEGFGHYGKRIG